jgi:hypothetical protein
LWFSSIDHTEQAKLAASLWYRQKAQELSRLQAKKHFTCVWSVALPHQ